ncbi:hypothetical protein [Lacticaseibacillus hulanensis]|uniref:hypothetical protein n=1 Tax=Lacticaseibacillus hulanensis TaxID=2493111 RepID=UPI000FDA2B53|nr:hypothetical protein [Lacticaseibacillus hulanensis]
MRLGMMGAIAGGLLAAAILQWGFWGLVFIILLASAGFLLEKWLLPNKESLWQWLRSGKKVITRGE